MLNKANDFLFSIVNNLNISIQLCKMDEKNEWNLGEYVKGLCCK